MQTKIDPPLNAENAALNAETQQQPKQYTFQHGVLHLPSVLTNTECESLRALSEQKGYITQIYEPPYIPEVRQRAMFMEHEVAALLTARIVPHLPPLASFYREALLPQESVKQLFPSWQPLAINERLRFYRYAQWERFAPHQDHEFARTTEERTFLSVVIYLNDNFKGGATQFSEWSFSPVQGDALVYAHELMHEGGIVTDGSKLILRTDIFYRYDPDKRLQL